MGKCLPKVSKKDKKNQNDKCCPSVLTFNFELTFFVKPNSV